METILLQKNFLSGAFKGKPLTLALDVPSEKVGILVALGPHTVFDKRTGAKVILTYRKVVH